MMKKFLWVCGVLALISAPAFAVPFSAMGVPNTFGGAAVAEDAGYLGDGTLYSYAGSEVSVNNTGGAGSELVNLPQASAALGAALGFAVPTPTPAGFIFETTQVKDGSTVSFGQELTAVVGGLWPTALVPVLSGGAPLDNGAAPGSTAADGTFDQLVRTPPAGGIVKLPTSFTVTFGPDSVGINTFQYPTPPVFEIYDDVPVTGNLDISASSPLVEADFDFDGTPQAVAPFVGPAVPPVTASPSQFLVGGEVANAVDGTLWAAGFIDNATVTYNFFDPTVIGSDGITIDGVFGYVYKVDFNGKGVIVEGSVMSGEVVLGSLAGPSVWDPSKDINITFSGTLFGLALPDSIANPGVDQFAAWGLRTSLAGNSGDASFTVLPLPIPEPTTIALLGLGLVPAFLRRRKKVA